MPDQIAERSEALFKQGLYCAESVLLAIAESRGLRSELIPKMATGLCSGIARTGGMCGAVSGGILAINLVAGRNHPDQSVEPSYQLVRAFLSAFELRFGTTNCERLIGCRLDTAEGQQFFRENNLREKCQLFTREAARLASIVLERQTPSQDTRSG
ncbi:MAG TPA: C-GCAxxG-C-C family protein [Bacillota bacterium]|nr:C-GCAxxG-C-C family protein [Bacillota bacterium]